ncbi:MAG: aspartate:alanine exchanger family transporter, partial [Anaerolineae bacterium]
AIGYPLGSIKIGGSSLGVAAVLFVGLAFGALHPDMKLPELVYQLGLVVFVYTVGLSSGRQFFASFRRRGLRDNLFILVMLIFATVLVGAVGTALRLSPGVTTGMFTGSFTNTAALAAALEYIKSAASPQLVQQMLAEPVIGFSLTYPMGVIGMILVITVLQRVWKIDYAAEASRVHDVAASSRRLVNRTIQVTEPAAIGVTIAELLQRQHWDVVFGRLQREEKLTIAAADTQLHLGDLVSVVGTAEELDKVAASLGLVSEEHLELDRGEYDFRRVFVSRPHVAGQRLRDLNLPQQFGAVVTRVRRGDIELLAQDDLILELGDRVRVVVRRENMDAITKFFGDSYKALSEIDILPFNLGLALGILLGMLPIPLPGGVTLKLGIAGGPLIAALILGAIDHTGPLVWNLSYNTNLTLRQIGLVLFLAGVGTRSGYAFVSTLQQGGGVTIFIAGALLTMLIAFLTLWIGRRVFKIPMGLLLGMTAGLQTQPAVLGYALQQTGDELPNIGYAAVYPIALISKILLAQILLAVLLRL